MENEVTKIEKEIYELKQRLSEARRRHRQAGEAVEDYVFANREGGETRLSALFGDKRDLLLIHNMGQACPYCTLWADGFNSLYDHLADRATFVLVSPDEPSAQADFAASRQWRFPMVSDQEKRFTRDMGYIIEEGLWPGVSAFHRKDDGTIHRTGHTFFGPGDDFCSVWPLFDLLAEGANGWEPKYRY